MKTWDDNTNDLVSRIKDGLSDNDIILGWSDVTDLINEQDWEAFKQKIASVYPELAENKHRLGSAAGNLWRFVRDMSEGDYAIVPDSGQFYVARVTGPARYEADHASNDTAHRRRVEWLNNGKPIPRVRASTGLQSRMKAYQTVAWADEFTSEIQEILAATRAVMAVGGEIGERLCNALLNELRNGRMNDRLFERFVASLLERLGCSGVIVVGRGQDKGADILGNHDALGIRIAVQVKYYNDVRFPTDRACLDELEKGMEAESANIGWAVTLGKFDESAQSRAIELRDRENLVIRLIDGDELAKLAIEYGVPTRFDTA
jgi:predicted Mrr-cat superfamily restriction endonuclease